MGSRRRSATRGTQQEGLGGKIKTLVAVLRCSSRDAAPLDAPRLVIFQSGHFALIIQSHPTPHLLSSSALDTLLTRCQLEDRTCFRISSAVGVGFSVAPVCAHPDLR